RVSAAATYPRADGDPYSVQGHVNAVPELVWIIDPTTGDLVVEGLEAKEALALAGDLLPPPLDLNCARPLATVPLPESRATQGPVLRVRSLYHASVVEVPGRRSVLQTQWASAACPPCFT